MSTPSPGTANSEVAVYSSVTVMEEGLKVIELTVVAMHGFVIVRV